MTKQKKGKAARKSATPTPTCAAFTCDNPARAPRSIYCSDKCRKRTKSQTWQDPYGDQYAFPAPALA